MAPYVTLPDALAQHVSIIPATDADPQNTFPYLQVNEEEEIDLSAYDRIISVTGLQAQDIFYRRYRDEQRMLRETITETWQYLLTYPGRILLVGTCDPKLLDVLWPVVKGKGYLHNGVFERPLGSFAVLDPEIDLSFLTALEKFESPIPELLPPDAIDDSEDYSLSIAMEFDAERRQQVDAAFREKRVVCILGHTGTGKSYFMRSYPGVIIGDIPRWIREGGTLFIDEANLIKLLWAQFASVLWDPPCIFYQGTGLERRSDHCFIMQPSVGQLFEVQASI